jgi:hypothetical protein
MPSIGGHRALALTAAPSPRNGVASWVSVS